MANNTRGILKALFHLCQKSLLLAFGGMNLVSNDIVSGKEQLYMIRELELFQVRRTRELACNSCDGTNPTCILGVVTSTFAPKAI